MNPNLKIKAGALQFVLFIASVIALLLLSFVALAHTNRLFGKKTVLLIDTVKKTDMGLHWALQHPPIFNDSVAVNLGFEEETNLRVIRERWGVFEKYTAVSKAKKTRFAKSVLTGNRHQGNRPALYLQDNQRPMIIVGQSEITGDAFLPKQGIRPGNISGNSFYGRALVQGRQQQSNDRLPRFEPGFREHLTLLTNGNLPSNYESIRLSPRMQLNNSFQRPTKILSGGNVNLSGVSLTGNILVWASQRITVDSSCSLRDVVLIAPEIIVKDRVTGIFQAIAGKRIAIGKQCELGYPSALAIYGRSFAETPGVQFQKLDLSIGTGTLIKGTVQSG